MKIKIALCIINSYNIERVGLIDQCPDFRKS